MLHRVGDGGGAEDELRGAAVALSQAAQAAQHQGGVAAEGALVGVCLVHHHKHQAAQEAGKTGVARQHGAVKHVRVGEQDAGVLTQVAPLRHGRVAVVHARQRGVREGEGGEEVQRP